MIQTVPDSIKGENEEFATRLHAEWQELLDTINVLRSLDMDKGERIEHACRLLWDMWQDEDKRQAMGWAGWEDLFNPHQEELNLLFDLLEDRISLGNASNQARFYNLLLLDSDPTIAGEHILRRRHWTAITQFGQRISRLKECMKEPDGEDKQAKVQAILEEKPNEPKDPDPQDKDFELKRTTAYWRGKPVLRLSDSGTPVDEKFRARLLLVQPNYVLKRSDSKVLASTEVETREVATILMPQSDKDYNDFVAWFNSRLGVKIAS